MNLEDLSGTDILEITTPIMDNLMKASTRIDYKAHVRDFSDRMKKVVSKEHLKRCVSNIRQRKDFLLSVNWSPCSGGLSRQPSCGNSALPKPRASLWRNWYWCIKMVDISTIMP